MLYNFMLWVKYFSHFSRLVKFHAPKKMTHIKKWESFEPDVSFEMCKSVVWPLFWC